MTARTDRRTVGTVHVDSTDQTDSKIYVLDLARSSTCTCSSYSLLPVLPVGTTGSRGGFLPYRPVDLAGSRKFVSSSMKKQREHVWTHIHVVRSVVLLSIPKM